MIETKFGLAELDALTEKVGKIKSRDIQTLRMILL